MYDTVTSQNLSSCLLQLLTKIGILPALPVWTDAGKVWIESHPSFPLGML